MSASSGKGYLVERVVAQLHETPGVTIQRRVKLPPKSGEGTGREIDVLLISSVAGYPIRLAIECKNEGKAIEAPAIDAFIGKLEYIGIPVQYGIYVAARGYSRGAKERAAEAGIKLFTITGLTPDRLAAAVYEAFQSVVFLFLRVKKVSLFSALPEPITPPTAFTDEKGNGLGTIFDPIWSAYPYRQASPEPEEPRN